MTILNPTTLYAEIVWLGLVRRGESIEAEAVETLDLDWGGPLGDTHHGLTRPACVRVRRQYQRASEIRNTRQLSLVSEEELTTIAADLGVASLAPDWLGATVMVRGLPDLTRVPPASRLIAGEGGEDTGVALVTDTENAPCNGPAKVIEAHYPGQGLAFPRIARHRRGLTAWVERPGQLRLGDRLRLHLPQRHPYEHA
ncbi:MAG: sulfurase [Pseudomonadota bacterium]